MSDLVVEVKVKNSTRDGAEEAKRAVRSVGDEAQETARKTKSLANVDFSAIKQNLGAISERIRNVGAIISGLGQNLTVGLSAPIAAVTALGLKFNATKEQALVAFGVLLKSGEKAKTLFADLTKFAADTPFEMPEIQSSAKSLLAFGVAQEKILPTLKQIGDLASGVGVPLNELAEIYGKAKTQGRLFSEDINQLTGRGIPIIQELAKQFNISESEVKKLVESGKVGFPELEKAFASMTSAGGQFEGMMQAQSKTFSGMMSTLADNANVLLGQLSEPLFNFISQNLPAVIGIISQIGEVFAALSPQMQTVITIIAAVAAAAGPLLVVFGTLIGFIGTIVSGFGALIGVFAPFGAFIISFIGLIGEAGLVASFSALASVLTGTVTAAVSPVLAGLASLLPVIAAVAAVIAVLIGAAVALYAAWQTNFGGIQDFVTIVAQAIKTKWTEAVEAVRQLTADVTAQVSQFWQKNGADIMRAVETTSANVKRTWQSVVAFWTAHGDTIKATTQAVWNAVKSVVLNGIAIISNAIKLVAAIVNGDWSKAWMATQNILASIVKIWLSLLVSGGRLVINAVKLIFTGIWSMRGWVIEQAASIGKNIVEGLINGISSLKDRVVSAATSVISSVIGIFRDVPEVRSPSRVTTKIGEFISEGLAVGMESKTDRVRSTAKRVAGEAIKAMREAMKEFQKLAGASPETVSTIQQTDRIKQATADQSEIIKLRGQLGLNQSLSLPTDVAGVESEISMLRQRAAEAEKYNKTLDDLRNSYGELQEAAEKANEEFTKKIEAIQQNGNLELLKLREEVSLTGVIDEGERRRIQNVFEILRLREQMANDGYGQQQIDEAAEALRIEQARASEWQRILDIRKQVAKASEIEKDLTGKLSDLQNGNRELSEYEKTLRKINIELKDISPQQRENLLILAQQIDAQKEYNKAYEKTYGFIRGTFETLADSGKSIKEKLGDIFGNIFSSFKKMLLDMAAAWLSSKLLKIFNVGGTGNGNSNGGFSLGNIFGGLFGGNNGGIFGGNSQGFPNVMNFNGGSNSGLMPNSSGGSLLRFLTPQQNLPRTGTPTPGFGFNGGTVGGIGALASLAGSVIGGRFGNILSMAGTGASIGSMFGPIGGLIGAGAGALFGLLSGDPKKKRDKNEKLPQLEKGFTDALAQLRAFGADKTAFYNDPEGIIAKAVELRGQIASGFGLQFESKKYQKHSQQLINQKLGEADTIIAELERLKNRALKARDIDSRLQTNFATGVYIRDDQMRDMRQALEFKRRNGMLTGKFTGVDSLPSMLAKGEMVLNPMQIQQVIWNAGGHDPFHNAGIPGYADGGYITPSSPAVSSSPTTVSNPASSQNIVIEKINIVLEGEGVSNVKVKEILIDNLKKPDVQVEVVEAYDKGKSRTR